MDWLQALVLGLVQGLTEFLPVSSSGHLAIGKELLGINAPQDLVFEVTVHAATVLATIVVFRKQLWGYVCGLLKFRYNDETDYVAKILLSMIPVFVVGVFFKDYVEALFSSFLVVGFALLVTAALLFVSDTTDRYVDRTLPSPRNGISFFQALMMGLGQAFAVIPGLSRSGTTISTGLICRLPRENAAQFSFLMVIIPILGEAFLDLVSGDFAASQTGVLPLAVGFASAFVSGLFACKVMIALVKRAKLKWFALYCLIAGLSVIMTQILA